MEQIIKAGKVMEITALSHSGLYAEVRKGTFPTPIKITGNRASGWALSEVQAWVQSRVQAARGVSRNAAQETAAAEIA
jgi:prophage regulatory protein